MFGCLVAGRLLQTNLMQVDETHAYFELPNANSINHLCVFLIGEVPFPEGYAAAVHFYLPGKGFQLLGMISNDKPSAIFRLRGTFSGGSASASQNRFSSYSSTSMSMSMSDDMQPQDVAAILGLSIEPLANIQNQLSTLQSSLRAPDDDLSKNPALLAERVVQHLFNYLSGFSGDGRLNPDVVVPLGLIQKWYEGFLGKIRAGGIGFLERSE